MLRYDVSRRIDHPATEVWGVVTDLARTPEWRGNVRTIEPPPTLAVGERFAGTTRLLGRTWTWGLEITVVEPPHRFGYRVIDGVAAPAVEYVLAPTDGATEFTMSGRIDDTDVATWMLARTTLPFLRREARVAVARLERIVDAES